MTSFDKVVELKALEGEEKNPLVEVLQYAFLIVMDKKEYQEGTVKTRLALLKDAYKTIEELVIGS